MDAIRKRAKFIAVTVALVLGGAAMGEPVGWRGDGTGRYEDARPPREWGKDRNVVWKTPMPGNSFGSPIVLGDKIFVMSDPAELLCIQASDGKMLWQRPHTYTELLGPEKAKKVAEEYAELDRKKNDLSREYRKLRKENPKAKDKLDKLQKQIMAITERMQQSYPPPKRGGSGNSACTPVSDGKTVYAVFGHGVVSAHTLDGKRLWMRFLQAPIINFGQSSSPVLAGGKLIVHYNNVFGLDAATGKTVWQADVPPRHSTAVASRVGNDEVVVTPAGAVLRVADGKAIADGKFRMPESSAVLQDGVLYTSQGSKAQALQLGGKGLEVLWEGKLAGGRRTPSPVYHGGLLYSLTTRGLLDVTDGKTGQSVYRRRLDEGNYYSSPTVANNAIYLTSMKGTTIVLAAGRQYKEIARNELESAGSCPVFVGRRMYYRGRKNLYCIGDTGNQK